MATATKSRSKAKPAENRPTHSQNGRRIVYGPSWWKESMHLSQAEFMSAELIDIPNGFWDGKHPDGQYYSKYAVLLADGREVVFGTRVTDVLKTLGAGEALLDWVGNESLSNALGRPILRGQERTADGTIEVVLKGWRKIKNALERQTLANPKLELDTSEARLKPFEGYSEKELLTIHQLSYEDRYRKRDEAAELGTLAHNLIEGWVKRGELSTINKFGEVRQHEYNRLPPEVQNALQAFWQFWKANNLELVASEQFLADLEWGVAGTVDCVCRVPSTGAVVLLDWKTSGGVYAEYLLQVGAYARLWELCISDNPIDRAYIVRLDKETADLQVVPAFENAEQKCKLWDAWGNLVLLTRQMKGLNSHLEKFKKRGE